MRLFPGWRWHVSATSAPVLCPSSRLTRASPIGVRLRNGEGDDDSHRSESPGHGTTSLWPPRSKITKVFARLANLLPARRRSKPRRCSNPGVYSEVPQPASPTSLPLTSTDNIPDSGESIARHNGPIICPSTPPTIEQPLPLRRSQSRVVECYSMRKFFKKVEDTLEFANTGISHIYRRAERKGVSHEFLVVDAGEYSIRLERRAEFFYSRTSLTSSYPPVDEARNTRFSCIVVVD